MTISNKERIGNGLLVPLTITFNAESLRAGLAAIAERPLFCTWKLEPNPDKPDKPRKVPYVRGGAKLTGGYDDPKLAEKLMTLEAAIAEYARLGHAGIGLVFSPGCGVVGLDLDHCIDPEIGWTLKPEQKISLGHFKKHGFIEVSQSGTGLHVIALGDAVTQKANGVVEVFGNMNFLALTGAHGRGIARQMPSESIAEVAAVINQIKDNKRQKPADSHSARLLAQQQLTVMYSPVMQSDQTSNGLNLHFWQLRAQKNVTPGAGWSGRTKPLAAPLKT